MILVQFSSFEMSVTVLMLLPSSDVQFYCSSLPIFLVILHVYLGLLLDMLNSSNSADFHSILYEVQRLALPV